MKANPFLSLEWTITASYLEKAITLFRFDSASMLSTTGDSHHPLHRADDAGSTPLLEAVRGGYHALVEVLLGEGAELELRDPGTVLCDAVLTGNMDQLKLLLDCGADANATNYVG